MISMTVNGLNRLQKYAQQFPAITEKYVNAAINKSLVFVWGQEKLEAPFGVSGILRDNWKITVGRFTGSLTSLAPYAAGVEYGTLPHMPNVQELMPWAAKKGLNPWAVAANIKKYGTKANPFLQRAVDNSNDGVEGIFAAAIKSVAAEVNIVTDD